MRCTPNSSVTFFEGGPLRKEILRTNEQPANIGRLEGPSEMASPLFDFECANSASSVS